MQLQNSCLKIAKLYIFCAFSFQPIEKSQTVIWLLNNAKLAKRNIKNKRCEGKNENTSIFINHQQYICALI